ncbi:hypothetical protein EDM00_11725 [Ornithobacterium rhinotracheale]|nr:hypothetical protein [Ornithobacterium rhinotracheale]
MNFFSEFTGFVIKSAKDLTERQAYELIRYLNTGEEPKNHIYALYSKENAQHRAVISRAYQLCWTEENNAGKVDLNKLGTWLISKRCPVNKELKKMTKKELSKVIYVLDQLVKWKNGRKSST